VTLDIEQERLAANIWDGHRLFYGVAGSGKTLILLSRAKMKANCLLGLRSPTFSKSRESRNLSKLMGQISQLFFRSRSQMQPHRNSRKN